MAQIRLSRYEVEANDLPPLCICCGAPAVVYKSKNFAWHPSWVWILIVERADESLSDSPLDPRRAPSL
jgi:hypothetical protein